MNARDVFGGLAYILSAGVIFYVLSPYVPAGKEQIANVILGSALTWPAIPLSFYFGSSSGSKEKTELMAHKDSTLDPTGAEQEQ